MKTKTHTFTVEGTCNGCPFLEHDPNYGMSYDSGYDCNKMGVRLADDGTITKYQKALKTFNEKSVTLFPDKKIGMANPLDIPDNCPLEDVKP